MRSQIGLDSAAAWAHRCAMAPVRKRDATAPCEKCGAAMAIVKVQPAPDDPELELHMFRCEICADTAFFTFRRSR